ncbi:MAG TPA: lysyl oxidase family protein [Kofleriaceae bacterium]|nr:lysyl oxidase family protein [Kofleriaceae bacterium]
MRRRPGHPIAAGFFPSVCASTALAGFLACGSFPGATGDAAPPPPDAAPPDAAPPDAGLPDLQLNLARARIDLAVREAVFQPDACELDPDEACIAQPGVRRLLHFSVETPNLGDGDMLLGEPDPDNPSFHYSACHGHYHFEGYAEYRLIDPDGGEVAAGRKQAFCLLDTERYAADDPTVAERPHFTCRFQGIQRGWADVYEATLPCQFIDVTDVPDGAYTLEIRLNTNRTLIEKDYDNDVVSIPVELGSVELAGPTEPCPDGVDAHSSAGTHRECGWELAGEFDCEPGTRVDVGCSAAAACGGASCTGDPMIRICDAERPDANCSAPAAIRSSNDTAGGPCPCTLDVPCPASGRIAVYGAPAEIGQPYECSVAVQPAE